MKKQTNLSRLMDYAGSFRFLTYASWALSATSALLALVPYWYIWSIIQEAIAVMPNFADAQDLVYKGWMAVIFAILSALIYVAGLMCSHLAAFRVASNMKLFLTQYILALPLGFVESFGSGKLRKIVNESGAAMENYLAHKLPDKAGALATPFGLIALLLFFDWRLGLLSLAPVVLAFGIMTVMTGERMRVRMTQYQDALGDMSNEAVEYVRGIPVVKTFGQTVFTFKRFKGAIDRYKTLVIAYTKELCMPMVAYTTAVNSVFAFLIAAALVFTSEGVTAQFTVNLLFYVIITPVISLTLTKIMYQSENIMIVDDAFNRVDSVLSLSPLEKTLEPKTPADHSVELRSVSFSYDGQRNVLDEVSFVVESGQTVALVGPSGSGKTTLANLVARFSDPQKGEVLIGGVNAKDIPKEELMDTISFVFQNSRLIKASITDNVRMGKPDATPAEIMQALFSAQCMDIIEKLPQGVDTVIGSQGTYLSGGEQQRLVIARAILKNTPILVLDEATAFADPDNEVQIQRALSALSKDKTVIMIAHRLSTVANVDKIFVVEEGKIVESGTVNELTERGGLFSSMWNSYRTSMQWKVSKEAGA